MMKPAVVLSIAGSDPSAGAGLQADLKTISATGCYAATAVTAVTVQNTLGVRNAHAVPAEVVAAQIDAVIEDLGADAVKVGMLPNAEVVAAVAERLSAHRVRNLVVDPVMVSTSGRPLMSPEAVATLRTSLLPLATVVTPNVPEAEALLGIRIASLDAMCEAARQLSSAFSTLRPVSVLLKGGHLTAGSDGMLTDVLYDATTGECLRLSAPMVDSRNTHGTGCTLSSALASFLAHGRTLAEAARMAKDYLHQALVAAADMQVGHGHGSLHHFWATDTKKGIRGD